MKNNHLSFGFTDTQKINKENLRQPQPHILEEKMSRKGQNTTKNNTTPVKPKDPTTPRLEQPNIDKAEENDLKITSRECWKLLKK